MNSISSLGSSMSTMMMGSSAKQRPDPEEMYNSLDTDGNGSINASELSAFVEEVSQRSELSLDAEEALATYDTDGDGGLSQEEMGTFMAENMPAPPPPPTSQVLAAYNQNEGSNDMMEALLAMLGEGSDEQAYTYVPLDAEV